MLFMWMEPRTPIVMIMRWVDYPALGLHCNYMGFIFALFSFDGLVCEFVVSECEFYYLDDKVRDWGDGPYRSCDAPWIYTMSRHSLMRQKHLIVWHEHCKNHGGMVFIIPCVCECAVSCVCP